MSFDSIPGVDPRLAEALGTALAEMRGELRAEIARLRGELGLAPPAAAPAPAPAELDGLLAASRVLDEAASQTAVLAALLEATGALARRALFLVARDGALQGWASCGFGPAEIALDRLRLEARTGTWADCLRGAGAVRLGPEDRAQLLGDLAPPAAAEAVAVPLALRGTVAGVLYLDREPEDPSIALGAAQLLTYLAANALETLPLRGGTASPTLRQAAAPIADAEPVAVVEPGGAPWAATPPALELEEPSAVEEAAPPPAAPPATPEPLPEQPVSWQFETVAVDRRAAAAELEPEAPPLAPEGPEAEPAREVKPPADLVGPGWAFTSPGAGDREETRHEEARRLARLLVTEIKLYNEEKVEESRERGNIYAALREEIDRSRRIFEERVAADLRAEADYFHDELVRILADGNAGTLGV